MGSRKPMPRDRKNPQQQQLEEDQRIRRLQEKAFCELEQEEKAAKKLAEFNARQELTRQAKRNEAHNKHLISIYIERKATQEREQLASYTEYKDAYNKNLVQEGFEIRDENWEKRFLAEDGTTQAVKLTQLPNVYRIHDIPRSLNFGKCTYEDTTWEEIKHEHMWYVKRNTNYSKLGFVINRSQSRRHSLYDGIFSFHVDEILYQVWTWPGATGDDSLPPDNFPLNISSADYQDRSITEMDDFVLQRSEREKYLEDINRLPSAQLGGWKDHWHRQMRDIDADVIETYVSVPVRPLPVKTLNPSNVNGSQGVARRCWTESALALYKRLWWSDDNFLDWSRSYHYELRLHEVQGPRCYDRKIWRQLLDTVDWLSYIARRRDIWLSLFQRCSFWSKRTLLSERKYIAGLTTYEVPGMLNGQKVLAFPDSGSAYNLLSCSYVNQQRITFEKQESTITLPNGTEGQTIGSVELHWVFEDAPDEVHKLLFYVLKNCVHDVLLGKLFLEDTKLNTDNDSRIKQRIVLGPPSSTGIIYDCHLTGDILNSMSGNLNGLQSYVIPDSGCQVNAMSLAQALALGWDGKYRGERGTFKFIDGSTALSLGAMRVMWSPTGSEEKYELEFEIMENCKGIIVGQKYLYGNRAFVKHAASMINFNASNTIKTDEIANEESEKRISATNNLGGPIPPPPKTTIHSTPVPVPVHEIITTDDRIYGVTYNASPLARIRRRLRGSGSRDSGARSQTSSTAQEEMERRAVTENAIASMETWEARILAVEAEVNRRRFTGAGGSANVTLLGLLPDWYTGGARGEAETGDGSRDGGRSGSGNGNDDGTSRSS